jgi:hypothetical protein
MQEKTPLINEDGSIMVIALIILVLLTLLGISATTTSTIEVQIAGNDRICKQNFYLAEGAAMVALQTLEDAAVGDLRPATTTFSWLATSAVNMSDPATMLAYDNLGPDNLGTLPGIDPNARYGVVSQGIAPGSSLDMTAPSQLYEFAVYGLYSGNGQSHIVVGYRRRF